VHASDLKRRMLAGFLQGEESDSDDGNSSKHEELAGADENGPLGYEVEGVDAGEGIMVCSSSIHALPVVFELSN
jgi:hypothetical protein